MNDTFNQSLAPENQSFGNASSMTLQNRVNAGQIGHIGAVDYIPQNPESRQLSVAELEMMSAIYTITSELSDAREDSMSSYIGNN